MRGSCDIVGEMFQRISRPLEKFDRKSRHRLSECSVVSVRARICIECASFTALTAETKMKNTAVYSQRVHTVAGACESNDVKSDTQLRV